MEQDFEKLPVLRLVLRLGIPAMAAQIFNILYSITDRIFVGHIPGMGELALAGIGVCAPALTVILGLASLIGVGGAAVMSISVGRKDYDTAQKAINNAFFLLLVVSLLSTGAAMGFRKPLLYLLGCSERMYPLANTYFSIYAAGTTAALLGSGMNAFILAQGYSKNGMISVVLGAGLNTVLDPLFIYGLHMGIAGAALATVLSQIVSMVYVLWFLQHKDGARHIHWKGFSFRIIRQMLTIGSMSFMIVLLDNLIVILLNAMLRKYGGEALGDPYISSAAVIQSFLTIAFFPANGITGGCATLLGFYYGSGNLKRVFQTFRWIFVLCFSYMLLLCLGAQIIPEVFVRLFIQNKESVRLTAGFLKAYTLGLCGVAVQYTFVEGLTAMGKVRSALPLSLFRKMIYIGCIFVIPIFWPLERIFFAGTIADAIGGCFTACVYFLWIKKRL